MSLSRSIFSALFCILFFSVCSFGKDIKITTINHSHHNGESIILQVKNAYNLKFLPPFDDYKFFKNTFLNNTSSYYAFVPIDYYYSKKYMKFQISYTKTPKDTHKLIKTFKIRIKQTNYTKEAINTKKRKIKNKQKHLQRITKEYKEAMRVYNTITPNALWSKKFILPLHSHATSQFGKSRIYNKNHKSYHSGIDFRAKINTKITASNDGVVAYAKDRFYSGKSVCINHGQGVYSVYYHLNKILVKKGDIIKRGEIVGLSGKSGRVTGPHLHFGIKLYSTNINPKDFIKRANKLLAN